ncbi:unnamed protein product [Mytilus edulis]|uniref:Uncharacterized protein n=1 Tax=Mytilus edulis TaxID=6550 RepID=A0A8S3S8Z6_MYTED|nr:unnamed protein product [Mytilus edulis]
MNDFEDFTQKFIIKKMMEGVNRTRPKIRDSRLPITKELLLLIVKILPFICSSCYAVKLFKAAFSLANHGLLRIGELAVSNEKGGTNLCLDRLNTEIWWQGKSGMVTSQLRRQIRIMKKYEDPPKFLVVHVGANDLGNIKTKDLREKLIQAMTFISKDLPDTKIVWSQMLPRLNGDILTMVRQWKNVDTWLIMQ